MQKNTLFELIYPLAHKYCEEESKTTSIVGRLIHEIKEINYFRDSQYEAIETYLWIKEVAKNKKVSEIISSGILFENKNLSLEAKWLNVLKLDKNYNGIYLYYYLKDKNLKPSDFMDTLYDVSQSESIVKQLLNEYEYTNFLYSLPMGAGKTFFIATCIYIDCYLYDKYSAIKDDRAELYGKNSLVLIPSAKKNSILNSLATIKTFNPSVLFGKEDGMSYKNKLKINIIDEKDNNTDKLKGKNSNLEKITQVISGHNCNNVFIINAEKINAIRPEDEEFDELKDSYKTRIEKSEDIRNVFKSLPGLCIYIDEAHHVYDKKEDETQLRKAISDINKSIDNGNLLSCICVSGTPYLKNNQSITIENTKINIDDIQDTIYYYPLNKGIGNFLKQPQIETISEAKIIEEGLTNFFEKYDKTYKNGACSKIAIYCVDSKQLQEVLAEAQKFCKSKNLNPNTTILPYYSKAVKNAPALPAENEHYFNNLDNPTSKHRIILLIGIGVEGWDCKSLTGVILPRSNSSKIFVLQSACRCLREVDDATDEKAYICLSPKNKTKFVDELYKQYRITIDEFTSGNTEKIEYKKYPITILEREKRTVRFNNVKISTKLVTSSSENNIEEKLKNFKLGVFQDKYIYDTKEETLSFVDDKLESKEKEAKKISSNLTFVEFIYYIIQESFGAVNYGTLFKYQSYLKSYYDNFKNNYVWFNRHPDSNILNKYCYEIAKLFLENKKYEFTDIPEETSITLLSWNNTTPFLTVKEAESKNIYPYIDWENPTEKELTEKYNKIKGCNKERMFNYYPLKPDSNYEIKLIEKMLNENCINDNSYELYYNGYTGNKTELERFQILTDVGIYTPDFLLLKLEKSIIKKILIIETKGEHLENDESFVSRENFVKEHFLKDPQNQEIFDYIKIGDIDNHKDYNVLKDKINNFFK